MHVMNTFSLVGNVAAAGVFDRKLQPSAKRKSKWIKPPAVHVTFTLFGFQQRL